MRSLCAVLAEVPKRFRHRHRVNITQRACNAKKQLVGLKVPNYTYLKLCVFLPELQWSSLTPVIVQQT